MNKHTWSGGLESNVSFEVVACKGNMTEQPRGLVINRDTSHYIEIDANERFMVILKVNGASVARLHSHRYIRQSWNNKSIRVC